MQTVPQQRIYFTYQMTKSHPISIESQTPELFYNVHKLVVRLKVVLPIQKTTLLKVAIPYKTN